MKYSYNIVIDDDQYSSVMIVTGDGETLIVPGEQGNIQEIVDALHDFRDIEHIRSLISIGDAIRRKFCKVDSNIEIRDGNLYYKGGLLNGALAETIVRAHNQGESDFSRLVLFLDRVMENPNPYSRVNLYRWLSNNSFSITEDGMIYGYKGLRTDLRSIHSGHAFVDGESVNGNIPNQPGSTISMPREDVTFDPNDPCSFGLHVGTYDYASSFGSVVMSVIVDPADVVSVPVDSGNTKMRTCKYVVGEVITGYEPNLYVSFHYSNDLD